MVVGLFAVTGEWVTVAHEDVTVKTIARTTRGEHPSCRRRPASSLCFVDTCTIAYGRLILAGVNLSSLSKGWNDVRGVNFASMESKAFGLKLNAAKFAPS